MAWQALRVCWCTAMFWHRSPAAAACRVIFCNCVLHWVVTIKVCIPVVCQSNAQSCFGSSLLLASWACMLSVALSWPTKNTECYVVFTTQADHCCARLVQCGVWWSAATYYQHTLALRPRNRECWHDTCQEQPGTAVSARRSSCSCLLSFDPGRPYRKVWQETAKSQVVWCIRVLMDGGAWDRQVRHVIWKQGLRHMS